MVDLDLYADAFYTVLLHCYNSMDSNIQLLLGDKPLLIQRLHAGKTLKIGQAKEMFEQSCEQWEDKNNLGFNP